MRAWPLALSLAAASLASSASGASMQYQYDPAGRLTGVSYGEGTFVALTYDPAGNLLSQHVCHGACLVGGRCYDAGAADPANECLECTPEKGTFGWTPAPSETTCARGTCDGDGRCAASREAGTPRDASAADARAVGDAGRAPDAAGARDAGGPEGSRASSGCGCRLASAGTDGVVSLVALALLAFASTWRRRHRVGASSEGGR